MRQVGASTLSAVAVRLRGVPSVGIPFAAREAADLRSLGVFLVNAGKRLSPGALYETAIFFALDDFNILSLVFHSVLVFSGFSIVFVFMVFFIHCMASLNSSHRQMRLAF